MKIFYTFKFKRSFVNFQKHTKGKFYKQIGYLLKNLRHPSLKAKKYSEKQNIWQARVDKSTRFYFLIEDDRYILLDIKKHPK
ncbi:MAG: hypothetical protein Q8R55_06050 [Candidatus Taylorbacteria bacterium]|nr:hypothetical protein [Candidatus Taylorbacteria bacterium]